jgi:hypothetical protein
MIRACLDLPTQDVRAFSLAVECVDEARSIDAAVREEVNRKIWEGVESNDPKRRRLASEVLLDLRLRNLLKVDDTLYIDTSYVTCAEYQLFLDDKEAEGESFRPDHWSEPHYGGIGSQPVVGLRYGDADAFCRWLSARLRTRDGQWRVTLPSLLELQQYPVHQATIKSGPKVFLYGLGAWTNVPDSDTLPSLGDLAVPSDFEQRLWRVAATYNPMLEKNGLDTSGSLEGMARLLEARGYGIDYNFLLHPRSFDLREKLYMLLGKPRPIDFQEEVNRLFKRDLRRPAGFGPRLTCPSAPEMLGICQFYADCARAFNSVANEVPQIKRTPRLTAAVRVFWSSKHLPLSKRIRAGFFQLKRHGIVSAPAAFRERCLDFFWMNA